VFDYLENGFRAALGGASATVQSWRPFPRFLSSRRRHRRHRRRLRRQKCFESPETPSETPETSSETPESPVTSLRWSLRDTVGDTGDIVGDSGDKSALESPRHRRRHQRHRRRLRSKRNGVSETNLYDHCNHHGQLLQIQLHMRVARQSRRLSIRRSIEHAPVEIDQTKWRQRDKSA
jgi:hypothetical protein